MLKRILSYWKPARSDCFIGGGLLMVSTGVELLQPWPIKWLVDYVFGDIVAPQWLSAFLPALGSKDVMGGIVIVCVSIVILTVANRITNTSGNMFLIRAGSRLVQHLRCHACDRLHRLSLAYHDKKKVGDSLYRVAYDSHAAQSMLNGAMVPIFTGSLVLIGAIIVMLQLNWLLTLVTIAITPAFIITIRIFNKRIEEYSKHYHENETTLISTIQESLSSIRAIQAFTLEPETNKRFRSQAENSLSANQRLVNTQLMFSACAGLVMALGTAAVVWIASLEVVSGRLSVGDILVFLAYLGMLYQPMNTFSQSASVMQSATAQLKRVFEVIDSLPDIKEKPNAGVLPVVSGHVEFRNVSFEYETGRPVLRDISFEIQAGHSVAIVGRTGAGKTTLASMLLRFYDPINGAIMLDGSDLRDLQVTWLRKQVSVVLQDPILFSTTIAENIAYGRPGATQQQIEEAARRAQADEFIRAMPKKYETILCERGVNLSGGQRQRISIARAFLKNAPILVLDEPTSALDAHTEEALMSCLQELMERSSTFIIAHRLSTVRYADEILVLDKGCIVERGSHEKLIAVDSIYRKMYLSQQGKVFEGDISSTVLNNLIADAS